MRIVVLFNLKTGANQAAYERWARETDIPGVRSLGSVSGFEVYRATGLLGSSEQPPYAYMEIIDVRDMDRFGAEVASAAVQRIAAEFRQFADDPRFILTERL